MAKKPQSAESFADLAFPSRGIDVAHGFEGQLPGTTPLGVNVRAYETLTERSKGGSRPGISQYVPGALPGVIQHLNIIVDPTTEALLDQFYGMGGGFGGVDGDGTSGAGQGGIPFTFPDLAGGGSAGTGFSGPPWPYPAPPAGWVYDTSTQGPPSSWGTLDGIDSRNPGRLIPVGGTGVQTNKNTVPLKVPTIVWSDPAAIVTGTALSGVQLNATARDPVTAAPVAGAFTYSPAAGAVLPAGFGQSLVTGFAPLDRRRYKVAAKIVHISVLAATDIGAEILIEASGSFQSAFSPGINVLLNGTTLAIIGFSGIDLEINPVTVLVTDAFIAGIPIDRANLVIPGGNTVDLTGLGTEPGITAAITVIQWYRDGAGGDWVQGPDIGAGESSAGFTL